MQADCAVLALRWVRLGLFFASMLCFQSLGGFVPQKKDCFISGVSRGSTCSAASIHAGSMRLRAAHYRSVFAFS
jgi:hypothetical protein